MLSMIPTYPGTY